MKLSKIVLAISVVLNVTAAKLSSHVVVPALRKAANIKARALDLAYKEHDKAYVKLTDTHAVVHQQLKRIEQDMKSAMRSKADAHKARTRFATERVL